MGFFGKIFRKEKKEIIKDKTQSAKLGTIDTCPNCNIKLASIPSKKKKCNDCGQFIYVRTRPQDRKKVLITEKEKVLIEEQWQQHFQETEDKKILQNHDFEKAKNELSKQFGKEASMGDVKWRVYNQRIIDYKSEMQWGLYRCNKLDMAILLIKEGRHEQALSTLFEVCYLDLNGSLNVPTGISREYIQSLNINDEFDPKIACLAPGVLSMTQEEILKLKLNGDSTKKMFIDINNLTKPKKVMPLTPEEAWIKLSEKIQKINKFKAIDITDTKTIFKEIYNSIDKKEYLDARELIQKIGSAYYSKKNEFPNTNDIKKHLHELLYSKQSEISNAAESLLVTIAKKDYDNISDLLKEYLKIIQKESDAHVNSNIISEVTEIDINLVKPFIPGLIKNLKEHPEWDIRRISAFKIGSIGTKNSELIKDAIPIMIEYIKKPYKVTKHTPKVFNVKGFTMSFPSADEMLGVDQTQWLKDAYIDSIGMIAKNNKVLILKYKSLFEEISRKDKSEYSRKKAKSVLDLL